MQREKKRMGIEKCLWWKRPKREEEQKEKEGTVLGKRTNECKKMN
jgi:hypothetical protein